MENPDPVTIAFTIGSRRLLRFDRYLADIAYSLDHLTQEQRPQPSRAIGSAQAQDGLRILSAPPPDIAYWRAQYPRHRFGAVQHYRRHFISMEGGYEAYLARFSAKTRSTLRRKRQRFEEADGGRLDLRAYRGEAEIASFLDLAAPLARRTYQARLLDAALPDDAASRRTMLAAAKRDEVRAFLLFLKGEPVAYLYLPVDGTTLIYAYLGYNADHANLSPGTVLQMAALESLFAEERFTHFDFTEGDGTHKALFGTDSLSCYSFVLLEPRWRNAVVLSAQALFDRSIAQAKAMLARLGVDKKVRRAIGR